jgi:hypothetical protein|eukprot:3907165-Prymnesium_polylepis.1
MAESDTSNAVAFDAIFSCEDGATPQAMVDGMLETFGNQEVKKPTTSRRRELEKQPQEKNDCGNAT